MSYLLEADLVSDSDAILRTASAPAMLDTSRGVATDTGGQMHHKSSIPVPISLTRGKVAYVDASDAPGLWRWKWSAMKAPNGRWYAVRGYRSNGKAYSVLMHRAIVVPEAGLDVDHADRDGLNNTRSNLRVASRSQNNVNAERSGPTSRFKGVGWHRQTRRWRCRMSQTNLGLFDDEVDAALAYDLAVIAAFGQFARPNFLVP